MFEILQKFRPNLRISKNILFWPIFGIFLFSTVFTVLLKAQTDSSIPYTSQEVSEVDGIPVLIKHLPDWEQVLPQAAIAGNAANLKAILNHPVVDLIDFAAGTEAVTALYPAGRLLIVEYSSGEASAEADTAFQSSIGSDSSVVYRRIGNYNAFVFGVNDQSAANALLDEVKYEKQIQWLGDNPFVISAERAFVLTTSDIFLSTVYIILIGIGLAIIGGLIGGYAYFQSGEQRRARLGAFTDAGGMTRLNLDGFTAEIIGERLLKD